MLFKSWENRNSNESLFAVSERMVMYFRFSTEPGPAQTMVGNLVKGARMAFAVGREIGEKDESDLAKKVRILI